jgi:hypothetical protein
VIDTDKNYNFKKDAKLFICQTKLLKMGIMYFMNNLIMEYAPTSHNRAVGASPPGGSGSDTACSVCGSRHWRNPQRQTASRFVLHSHGSLHPHFASPGRTSCGSDASQSPYTGYKRIANSRNVMRNFACIYPKIYKKLLTK